MKAMLEFDLDDPLDRNAHARCIKATNAFIVIHSLLEKLRQMRKYEGRDEASLLVAAEVEDKLHNLLDHYDINMDILE